MARIDRQHTWAFYDDEQLMRILIAGSNGMFGSAVIRRLVERSLARMV